MDKATEKGRVLKCQFQYAVSIGVNVLVLECSIHKSQWCWELEENLMAILPFQRKECLLPGASEHIFRPRLNDCAVELVFFVLMHKNHDNILILECVFILF